MEDDLANWLSLEVKIGHFIKYFLGLHSKMEVIRQNFEKHEGRTSLVFSVRGPIPIQLGKNYYLLNNLFIFLMF